MDAYTYRMDKMLEYLTGKYSLTRPDFVRFALVCLDQGGVSLEVQAKIFKILRGE